MKAKLVNWILLLAATPLFIAVYFLVDANESGILYEEVLER